MSAATTASLERRALSLGSANAIDFALQFALPIVLTRTLDPHAFGEYRLLWLAVSFLMILAPMNMAAALYYFLPRSDAPTQRVYVNQTLLWLALAGLASAWAFSGLNPWLPGKLEGVVAGQGMVVPLFVAVWIFASILDVLPTAEERVGWQAKAVVSLAGLRALGLSLVAIATRDLHAVLWALLAFATIKAALVVWYVARHHGLRGPLARRETLSAQVGQAAPFALSGLLHGLRTQADQWIAAALFTVTQFASFSVAAVFAPIVQVFRQSVNHVFMPRMSRHESEGDLAAVLALNSRANCMVALLVYPLLAFGFVFAEEVITLIYTRTYLEAAPVLRLFVIGLLIFVVEVVSVLFVLKQGGFAARVQALALLVAVPASLAGALHWGLAGAAAGSVAAIYLERALSLARIARLTATPLARLQDWRALASILGAAALAAGLAGAALQWSEWSTFGRLVAASVIVAATYPVGLFAFGQRAQLESLFAALRSRAPA